MSKRAEEAILVIEAGIDALEHLVLHIDEVKKRRAAAKIVCELCDKADEIFAIFRTARIAEQVQMADYRPVMQRAAGAVTGAEDIGPDETVEGKP